MGEQYHKSFKMRSPTRNNTRRSDVDQEGTRACGVSQKVREVVGWAEEVKDGRERVVL